MHVYHLRAFRHSVEPRFCIFVACVCVCFAKAVKGATAAVAEAAAGGERAAAVAVGMITHEPCERGSDGELRV